MTNYHTHSSYCDGSASPREIVEFALSHGFTSLGFSGHSPLPFENTFSIKDYDGYCREIRSLAAEYAGRLKELGLICEINTRGEIEYARSQGKTVEYLEEA